MCRVGAESLPGKACILENMEDPQGREVDAPIAWCSLSAFARVRAVEGQPSDLDSRRPSQ